MDNQVKPNIIGFLCNWCSYAAADLAGSNKLEIPANLTTIRVMCSSRVNPIFILEAYLRGSDGILIAGCHPGDCHYIDQNYKALRRYLLLRRTLKGFGVEPERIKLVWASAAEGVKLAHEIDSFVEQIRVLGPLNWPTWKGESKDTEDTNTAEPIMEMEVAA